jgi:hypothetical protein
MFNKFGLFFNFMVVFSIGCSANEVPEKKDMANPWGNYDKFIHLLSSHREAIVDKITYRDVCEPLVDEFIQEKVQVLQPQLILSSNAELIQHMNNNTACTDFKIKEREYIDGSQTRSFEIQAPYYLYKFTHKKSAYVGFMPSGAYSRFNPKTPNVIDFEDITMPHMDFWDVNQCLLVGGASAPTDRGDFGFGIVISPSRGLLVYRYKVAYSHVSLSVTPVLKKERKNTYCSAVNIKNIKNGE